ncbi:MAG: hypothetical protein JXA73_00990 [Acidobacteria bacterium]|nr:hypothetical protein [Acidobacteriota bacterium]
MKANVLYRMRVAAVISGVLLMGISMPANADQKSKSSQKQEKKQKTEQPQARQAQKAQQQKQDHPPGWDKGKKAGWGDSSVPPGQQSRLSQQRQQQLIAEQQKRLTQYRQYLERQQRLAEQRTSQLQKQRRTAQYRYQQQYFERIRQQQMRLQSEQHDYATDPYYYTAPIYRYTRGGIFYETNQCGADQLRLAANNGYDQGFRAGQADRQDRWNANYKDSYAYQDANYGYSGYYVSQTDYNHYFREGFRRGYEDGYNSRTQYGSQSNGSYSILGGILSQILNLQSLR